MKKGLFLIGVIAVIGVFVSLNSMRNIEKNYYEQCNYALCIMSKSGSEYFFDYDELPLKYSVEKIKGKISVNIKTPYTSQIIVSVDNDIQVKKINKQHLNKKGLNKMKEYYKSQYMQGHLK